MPEIETKPIKIKKLSLPVEGMTCASCVARVEKAIKKVDGVQNVAVNLATEKATFEFDESKIDIKDIAAMVEDAGYNMKTDSLKNDESKLTEEENVVDEKSDYDKQLRKDFIFAVILTVPIFILSMGAMFGSFNQTLHISTDYLNKILLILTTPVVFISGKRFYKIFWNNLKHFSADMNSLVAVGTAAAYGYSIIITLFPALIPIFVFI